MQNSLQGNKRIAKNSIFMSIRMVVVLFLTFYTTRIVLSELGVDDYGIYNVVAGFVTMFSFLSTSMSNGVQRFFNYELGKNGINGANKVFNIAIKIQVLTALVILFMTESIGIWYLNNKMVIPGSRLVAAHWIFQFSVFSFVLAIIQTPFGAAIMAHEKLNYYAIVSILDAVFKLTIVCVLSLFGHDKLIMYGLFYFIISIIDFMLYAAYARIHFQEIRFRKGFDKSMFYSMLVFSGWNFFGTFAGVMKEQGMNLILNAFGGPVVNAARGIANQVNGGLQSFVQNISIPIRPQVIKSYAQENYDRCINLTFILSKLSCCIIYFLSFPIILEIDYILKVWLGEGVPKHTSSFVVIVILITYVNNLNSPISGIIHASGKMRNYQVVTSLIALFCIPCSYFALYYGGSPELALFLVFVFAALSQIAALKILQTVISYNMKDYFKSVFLPFVKLVICTFTIPLIPRVLMEQSFLRLILVGLASSISIILVVYIVVLNNNERLLVSQQIKKIVKSK